MGASKKNKKVKEEKIPKKKRKVGAGMIISIILLIIAILACAGSIFYFYMTNQQERAAWAAGAEARVTPLPTTVVLPEPTPEPVKETPTPEPTPEPVLKAEKMLPNDNLTSEFACLIRKSDGAVMLDKNSEEKMFPASMSKVMTVIIALEELPSLEGTVTMLPDYIDPVYVKDASLAGFEPYEEVSLLDLYFGAMLPSGAEACNALACQVSPSVDEFVKKMNEKAKELDMKNTHFTNTCGLHDEDEYSTAHDMAILMAYAMQNVHFRTIANTPAYGCAATEKHPEGLPLYSTVFNGLSTTVYPNGAQFIGGKTGTTDEAGRCLLSACVLGEEEYYLCTAKAPADTLGNFDDAVTVYSEIAQ